MTNSRLDKLKVLLEDDPTNSFLLFAIAKELEGLGQSAAAITAFLDLVEKDADYVGTYYHLAKLYEAASDKVNALLIYEKGMLVAKKIKDLHALSELQNAKMNLELEE